MMRNIRKIMASDRFIIFMNIMRIGTFILMAILLYIMVSEIEAVKMLAYDPCQICMEKTGAQCIKVNDPFAR